MRRKFPVQHGAGLPARKFSIWIGSNGRPGCALIAGFIRENGTGGGGGAARVSSGGLAIRGGIGKRVDLVRVSIVENLPIVRTVWREGKRMSWDWGGAIISRDSHPLWQIRYGPGIIPSI